ncbi:MAG: glycoside hydrolase family 32 protein [Lachnospiraceae bacterium]|nr:glycoside hydrolase family 32 protein [Lachnospiraceae bacterium]
MKKETILPLVHFSPHKGWMNDPNGPVYFNGEYHVFFQHNPNDVYWDSMHWGHAKSNDLMHWEELPIALFPDEQGMIFSGSAFIDKDNITGLGSEKKPPVLLFYTSHDAATKREMQCMAYTPDMEHFYKYEGNPVIPGKENTPARDPQVFENKILGGFSLCLTVENAVEFYHSNDLISWEKTGEFRLPEYAVHGMIECPCMFEDEKHVLMMSMDIPDSEISKLPEDSVPHNRLMQYFVGTFDGKTFAADENQKETLLVDYGPDFYAGTIFSNTKDTILIAWLGDFSEKAKNSETVKEGFKGILSFPRTLKLKKTNSGYRLYHTFIKGCEGEEGVSYRKDDGEESITDGCVSEIIKDNGLKAYTSYK